mmetsp:Transcript_309/g.1078  ORF Transcript_309/g.1078 Transcript_309/m.1078 type:complete len:273 (-) Transcript_309:20-838(-)
MVLFLRVVLAALALSAAADEAGRLEVALRDGGDLAPFLVGKAAGWVDSIVIGSQDLSPLMFAAKYGAARATLKVLMAAGADVTLAQATTATTPLMFAAREGHADALRFLLKFDQNVDAGDEHGATALALAALECRADIARALIDYDADPYHADGAGNTVFHVGAFYCSEEMRAGPQAGAGADGRGRAFALALLDAKVRGGLDSLSQTGRAPLHLAAKANAKSYAHALRAAGADARLPSPADGATPAALARAGGFQSLADELVAPPRADDEEL